MKSLLLSLAGALLISQAPSLQAAILLNEIHLRTPLSSDDTAADGNHEFVEIRSTNNEVFCTDTGLETGSPLWILIIDNDGGSVGEIKEAWPLVNPSDNTPLRIGPNGLLLLGDDYDRAEPPSPYQFVKAPETTMGDPDGMSTDDLPDSDAITVLLVSGYVRPSEFPTTDPDVDVGDAGDGVFDWNRVPRPQGSISAAPWSAILDSVGFNGDQGSTIKRAYVPVAANLSRSSSAKGVPQYNTSANFMPHTLARSSAESAANSRTAWYGGTVSGTSADSVTYGTSFMNLIGASWPGFIKKGLVTPGQPNLSTDPVAPVFRINELNLNPPGTPGKSPNPDNPAIYLANDGNFEYIEIVNTVANQAGGTNFSGSLAGYALLMVDSGGGSIGKIRKAWNLNKLATGPNGLLCLGDDFVAGYSPFAGTQESGTQLADPDQVMLSGNPSQEQWSKLSRGDLSNNGVTFMLVTGYNGLTGVSTTDDLDDNNDGVLDVSVPYTALADSVSVPEVDTAGNLVAGQSGYSAAKPDIVVSGRHYNADNLSRIRGVSTANATAAWSAGVFGANNPYALGYRNGYNITGSGTGFRGAASPGKPNYNSTAPPSTSGTVLLNEVNINPPTSPDNTEYIEVISSQPHTLLTNYWLIVLAATPNASGEVKKVFDLRGQATGGNRLAIFADGVEEDTSALFPYLSAQTLRDDPVSYNANGTTNDGGFNFTPDSLEPDNGLSILLVSYVPTTPTGVPATPGADLDANNDGTLDTAAPWTLVDGISTGNGVGGVPAIPVSGFSPGNICRSIESTTANSAAAWFGGELTGGTATSFGYSDNYFGTFKGAASPGRHNVTATPDSAVALLLNEININPPGGDNDKEFVEILSANNAALSTSGYSILLIDNDGNDTGRVLECWDLDSAATGSNGLLLAGSGYAPGAIPWTNSGDTPDPATVIFAPATMDLDDIGRSTDNGAVTVLLVKNFRGRAGDDLDEGTQADLTAADDHVFNTPLSWDSQADSAAMKFFAAPDDTIPNYRLEGYIFPGTADLTVPIPPNPATGYTPDTVARFGGNNAANDSAAWYGANIGNGETSATTTIYNNSQFFPATLVNGKVTPGYANISALTDDSDTDGDGVPYLMEEALGMNPLVPDAQKLPQPLMTTVDNVTQPAFRVVRPSNGVAGITYTTQGSFNLQQWTLPMVLHSTQSNTPATGQETQTFLVDSNFLPLLNINKRVYFRLKVQRQ